MTGTASHTLRLLIISLQPSQNYQIIKWHVASPTSKLQAVEVTSKGAFVTTEIQFMQQTAQFGPGTTTNGPP